MWQVHFHGISVIFLRLFSFVEGVLLQILDTLELL